MCDSEHEKQIRNRRTGNWLCQLALGDGVDQREALQEMLILIDLSTVLFSVPHLRKRLDNKHLVHYPKRLRHEGPKKNEGDNSPVSARE
jgi:stress response protein SCP2